MERNTYDNATDEVYPFDFADFTKEACDNYVSTPNHGVWDKTLYDSGLERDFAIDADKKENKITGDRLLNEIHFKNLSP